MRFLVDSSVWLEALLNQAAAPEAAAFFSAVSTPDMAISQFALHSIGVVLTRTGQGAAYEQFVRDVVIVGSINVLSLSAEKLSKLPATCVRLSLDFDDAYQYAVAEEAGLTLVSFDSHFDQTPRGRQTPAAAIRLPPNP